MSELFETTPKSLPPKKDDDYKGENLTTIREVGEEWFINKMNAKPPPYTEKAIEKNGENQIRQIKEKLTKSNAHRNDWKSQLNWNKLEWVYKIYILGIIHSVL